jgi:hypothetical protein
MGSEPAPAQGDPSERPEADPGDGDEKNRGHCEETLSHAADAMPEWRHARVATFPSEKHAILRLRVPRIWFR